MTPQEQAFFRQLGYTLIRDSSRPIAGCIFYGISFGLCGYATYLFRTRRLRKQPTWVILATAAACFLLTTINFGGLIATPTIEFQTVVARTTGLPGPSDITDCFTPEENQRLGRAYGIYFLTQYMILFISDSIVIWRTRVLYPDRPHLFWFPVGCLVASIGCLGAGFILEDGLPAWPSTHPQPIGRATDDVGQALSLLTNLSTTIYVAVRLWSHRKWFLKHIHRSSDIYTPIQKKLLILVETGALFCFVEMLAVACVVAIDVIAAIGGTCSPACMTANWIISRFRFAFAANYSILVLVLVYSNRSFTDTCYVPSSDTTSTQTAQQFSSVEAEPIIASEIELRDYRGGGL